MTGIFRGPGTIRPSQVITTFGPGAIYDNLKDSFLIMGIDSWERGGMKKAGDSTLISFLKNENPYFSQLKTFLVPVGSEKTDRQIPVKTFPSWGVCPRCNLLQKRNGKARDGLFCANEACTRNSREEETSRPRTRPVRIITACANGHLDDFPWFQWAHSGSPGSCVEGEVELYLEETGRTTSLDSILVRCGNCRRSRPLAGVLTAEGLSLINKHYCTGRRPWLEGVGRQRCDLHMRGILKGASNVYFSSTLRSVVVPPFSDQLSNEITEMWDSMAKITDRNRLRENIRDWFPEYKDNPDVVLKKFEQHKAARNRTEMPDIHKGEFDALNSESNANDVDFKTANIPLQDYGEFLERLVLVKTLREIVVQRGFTRIDPDGGLASMSSSLPEWLPAVENRGEGIFLSFKLGKILEWEEKDTVSKRFRQIVRKNDDPFVNRLLARNGAVISPRYVMLHTLSHMLIRKLAEFSGYSVSSIRERIYGRDDMAGILLYTSSPSSDGSLGGLIEQGRKNFGIVMRKAIAQSRICSSDPLCALLEPGVGNRRSGCACHACLFLPETSCECMNNLLDRAFVHSTINERIGLFAMDQA